MSEESGKLLPCPFCGSQAAKIGPYGNEGLFAVQCLTCCAEIRGFDQCQQDAVDAWNTRAAPSTGEPVAWRIMDGETGGFELRANPPTAENIAWSARYGRKWEPLYASPPSAEAGRSDVESGETWRDDPSADERWNAGLDYGMVQLCAVLGVDPKYVRWDAATETLDGDVCAAICNVFRVKYGDDFDPAAPLPSPAANNDLRQALQECVDTLALVERPAFVDPDYGDDVKALGDRIGYGALMSSASASWKQALVDQDCPTGGEFVAGPCYATVVRTLKIARAALSATASGDAS